MSNRLPFRRYSLIREADAQLLEAAPDLLRAAKELVDNWDNWMDGLYGEAANGLRAAIAKAEGRE